MFNDDVGEIPPQGKVQALIPVNITTSTHAIRHYFRIIFTTLTALQTHYKPSIEPHTRAHTLRPSICSNMYTDAPLTHTSAAEYEHAKKHPLRPLLLVAVYTDRNTRTLPNHKYISGNMQRTHTHTVHRIILKIHTQARARTHSDTHQNAGN